MEEEVTFPNKVGENLTGYLHVPEETYSKGIVLAHCFTCSKHIGIIRSSCERLAKEGFLILRFDFSGNGKSEGKFEESTTSKEMGDLEEAISFILKKGVNAVGVLGHSLGAAVSMLQSCRDTRIKALCVLGAPAHTNEVIKLIPKEKVEEIKEKGRANVNLFFKSLIVTKEFIDDAEKHDLKKALSCFNRPLCIIHGSKDTIIPVENANLLYSYASKPKEIRIIEGSDHLFSKYVQEVGDITSAWFKKSL
jgi:putative redox protein